MTNIVIDPYKFGVPLTLTQVLSSSSASNTITLPVGIQAGDLIVLVDYAVQVGGTTDVVPTNFTGLINTDTGTRRVRVSYKIANGTEGGTSITGMNETTERKCAIVWRPNRAILSVTTTDADATIEVTGSTPAQQNQDVSALATPSVVLAIWSSTGTVNPRGMSPAKDGEVQTSTNTDFTGWKTYNSSPQSTAITMQDEGTNVMWSGHFLAA